MLAGEAETARGRLGEAINGALWSIKNALFANILNSNSSSSSSSKQQQQQQQQQQRFIKGPSSSASSSGV